MKILDNIWVKVLYMVIVPLLMIPTIVLDNDVLTIIFIVLLTPLLLMAIVALIWFFIIEFIEHFNN